VSPECDTEALRLAALIRWSVAPGVEERRAEERHFKVPFDPKRYKRWVKQRSVVSDPLFELPVDTALTIHAMRQVSEPAKPLIKGGMKALPNHLASELRYPAEAYRYSLEGEVVVEFVVETSGSLSNMRALQDVGGGCTDEALRLLHRTPWAPAVLNGNRVRSTMQVSIQFRLPKETR
jgi:protein TonB